MFARVAELVDASDLKSDWHPNASAGSSPASGTLNIYQVILKMTFAVI